MLYTLCNLNHSYSNGLLQNVGFFSYPNGILALHPRNFCISRSATGTVLLSAKSKNSAAIWPVKQLRHPLAVPYLVDNWGFSPEEAVALAKRLNRVNFDTLKADYILALLKKYGFDDTHITKAIRQDPTLLACTPEIRIIPKFEFFRSLGLSDNEIADIMTGFYPNILGHSFGKRIIPCYDFLKSVLVDDVKVVAAIKGYSRIFRFDVKQRLGPNVQALREAGLSESMISFALLNYFPLFHKPKDQFRAGVDNAIRLGFDPTRVTSVRALNVLIRMSKSTMNRKVENFKRWGFSDEQIADIFRKLPVSLYRSEEKIVGAINYLVNEMGFKPSDIASCPPVFNLSLEKRVIPRSSVVRVLQMNGLLGKNIKLNSFILGSEKVFLEKFVTKYVEQVPQLMSVYQGRVGIQELALKPEAIRLGFDKSQLTFVQAPPVLIRRNNKKITSKVDQFKRWGFSDVQIADISRKYPLSMCCSKEKLAGIIDYVINEMGFKPSDIVRFPLVLCCSLQKRIIPRWSVIRVLQMKGFLGTDIRLSSFLLQPDKVFLEKFVTKYEEQVPQLMSVYQGRVGIQELALKP